MAVGLQAQWDATYGPTLFVGGNQSDQDHVHFQQRVSMAIVSAAVTVATEVVSTKNHANRVAQARAILANPLQWMGPLAQAIASQGLDQTSTDTAIVNMLLSGWDAIAGAL